MTNEILMAAFISTAGIHGIYTDPDTGNNYKVKQTNKTIIIDRKKSVPIETRANIINKNKITKDYYE